MMHACDLEKFDWWFEMTWFERRIGWMYSNWIPCTVRILVRRKHRLLVIKSCTAVLRFAAQPASGNNLMRASAAAGQLSAAGTTGTKQQYGGCDLLEVKVYGGCGLHEVNVLRAPLACCKSTAGVTHNKSRLVRVEPAGETDILRGALESHTHRRAGGQRRRRWVGLLWGTDWGLTRSQINGRVSIHSIHHDACPSLNKILVLYFIVFFVDGFPVVRNFKSTEYCTVV
jgi:hypothetical protein